MAATGASSAHDVRNMDTNPFINQSRTLTCLQRIKIVIMCILMVPVIRLLLIFCGCLHAHHSTLTPPLTPRPAQRAWPVLP